jgi:hypothetical protein
MILTIRLERKAVTSVDRTSRSWEGELVEHGWSRDTHDHLDFVSVSLAGYDSLKTYRPSMIPSVLRDVVEVFPSLVLSGLGKNGTKRDSRRSKRI